MRCKNFMLVLSQLATVKTFITPFQSIDNLNILVSRRQQVIASGCLER